MTRWGFLIVAWVIPAIIAGALGWKGIWGTGNALFEFLIPLPVAGGALHVPSFLVLAAVILNVDRFHGTIRRYLPVAALAMFLVALALQLDAERLGNWLLTDYRPVGSPIRFDDNPLYLFLACDAFAAWLYIRSSGPRPAMTAWLVPVAAPLLVLVVQVLGLETGGIRFEIGGGQSLDRGRELQLVYASGAFDEEQFKAWHEELDYFAAPWHSPNYEQSAIYFSNSMDVIKWRRFDQLVPGNVIATACQYEVDLSISWHEGMFDCFDGRPTVEKQFGDIVESLPAEFKPKAKYWLATWQLCRDWLPRNDVEPWMDIRLVDQCSRFWQSGLSDADRLIEELGTDSPEAAAISDAHAAASSRDRAE